VRPSVGHQVPRETRQLRNREMFRHVNESIAELASRAARDGLTGFFCECSQIGCSAHVVVPFAVYTRVLSIPSAYLVLPGHETAEEATIVREDTYAIVVGGPAQ
jgi:hypothetical protein